MKSPQSSLLSATFPMVYKHVAGIPMEQVSGSKTGVYAGSMADDYAQILARDMDVIPKYTASGVARAMLANRISWFYNLQGPSISMDSACSGSLMVFDFACQGLRNGDFNMLSVSKDFLPLYVRACADRNTSGRPLSQVPV